MAVTIELGKITLLAFLVLCFVGSSLCLYENARCKCVCPDISVVNGSSPNPDSHQAKRKLYIGNVEPGSCNCEQVVLIQIHDSLNGKDKEFCPRCECKYESRNTMTIKVVVIIIIWIVSLLVVYMLFLMCLDPLLNKRAASYQEHTNEEVNLDETPPPAHTVATRRMSGNMLNRVGHQQYKWKRQVQEQRRNIYDRHTMLN